MPERNPLTIETVQNAAEDGAQARLDRQLDMLERLAEAGLEVAAAVGRRAKTAGPDDDLNGLSLGYARVSRAVRMTIALQSRLIADLKALADSAAQKRIEAEEADENEQAVREETHKVRVVRVVERVLEAEHEDDDQVSPLVLKAEHLLDDEDLYDDILSRPIGDLVAQVCRDLGLSPDWTRLAEEPWAKKEIERGGAGSPFGEWMGRPSTRPSPQAGEGGEPCAGQRFGQHANARQGRAGEAVAGAFRRDTG